MIEPGSGDGSPATAAPAPAVGLRDVVRTFWPYAAPRRRWMALALVLAAVGPVLAAAEIWLFKIVVDDVLLPRDFGLFLVVASGYLALTVLQGVLGGAERMLTTWLTQRFLLDVRAALLRHLGALPLDFFSRNRVGDLLSRVSGDVSAIETFLVSGATRAVTYALEVVLFTTALFVLQPTLALVSLGAAPVFFLASRHYSRRMREVSRERQRRSGSISTVVEQAIGSMPLVQAYDRVEDEVDKYRVEAEARYQAEMTSARLRSLYAPTVDAVELVGALLVIGVGVWLLSRDQLSIGSLLAFLTFLNRLYGPIRGLGRVLTTAYTASAGAERVIEVLHHPTLPPDRPGAVALTRGVGVLELDGVGYTYPGATRPAISEVSFRVLPGEVIGLVGPSGAGKSTIARMLTRSLDPSSGQVRLDGHDLRDLTRASLRRHVAVVLQETMLRNGSVRDNIAYGLPDADDDAIVQAARAADAHDFVSALPDGYATGVGDRGRRLSGGQAQRVALARALLLEAPVLVLDEPTSGLDGASAERVTRPLRQLTDRSVVLISHDLATVRHADRILVLDGGRVVEEGTHGALLARRGCYARLWAAARVPEVEATVSA